LNVLGMKNLVLKNFGNTTAVLLCLKNMKIPKAQSFDFEDIFQYLNKFYILQFRSSNNLNFSTN